MQYSNFDMKNNVHATLSTAISSVATTIQLTSGQGSRFGTTFPQIATLESIENGKVMKREIVKITGRSGDNLTVVRAFAPCPENDDANSQTQSAISFNADDTISLYIPKEIFDIIKKSLNDIYDNGTNNMRTDVVSGLQVEVNPGSVLVGSAYYDFAGGTITLTDNATNYLEIDEDGNLANNTTSRNDQNTKLAIITTAGGEVTNIQDWRLGTVGGKIGGVNIHDLTEKMWLNGNDEFIIADSENIYNNKKIKFSTLYYNMPFGTGSDGDCVIDTDTRICAKEYNFRNLTICSGVKLSFCGDGVPVIRVSNCFCNLGEIDLYAGDQVQCCLEKYSIIFDKILNICNNGIVIPQNLGGGKGGCPESTTSWIGGCGGNGGGLGEAGCDGEGTSGFGLGGQPGNNSGGGGGGGGKVSGNCPTCQVAMNGGDGGDGIGGDGGQASYRGSYSGGGGGGGFGLYKGGNGGSALATNGGGYGGNGGDSCYCGGKGGDGCKHPGKGGFGYFCCGGDGGDGLDGGGGDGGDSYYGNGGNGGYSGFRGTIGGTGGNSVYGTGGKGGCGIYTSICVGTQCFSHSGNGGCGRNGGNAGDNNNCYVHSSGCGGNARGIMYGLGLFVNSGYNTCINGKGGNGGNGSIINGSCYISNCTQGCQFGGNGADGANVYIYSINFTQGTIDVSGGKGGCGAKTSDDNYYCPGLDGENGILCYIDSINR